jgi:DNA polymerase-3 subunit gamma/tau
MTHQVLARKWRPRTFDEMAGQDHVRRALVNGLGQGRIHHAYLFTGTRGVGKTTAARILAKCLNCETEGVTAHPCGHCHACTAIDEGRFVDLLEVDAASRTKVEDTRELLDNVQYAPSRARYKIYLVDEVHMLSGHSFNALLKTLEEPPEHVKFLLATTDPHKLPVTILSRCLQFNLKHLPSSLIAEHLRGILEAEGMEAEGAAVRRLARAADGSVRDALSLTDQALAFSGSNGVSDDAVRDMLGAMDQDHVFGLLEAAAAGDGETLLATVARMSEHACDFSEALAEILAVLHQIAVAQSAPSGLDPEAPEREQILRLAEGLAPETCQLFYQIGVQGRSDLGMAPDPRTGFEMTLLRMLAFRPAEDADAADNGPNSARPAPSGPAASGSGPTDAPPGADPGSHVPDQAAREPAPDAATATAADGNPASMASSGGEVAWSAIVAGLQLSGMARGLAEHCFVIEWRDEALRLGLESSYEHLLNQAMQERLAAALRERYGEGLRLGIELCSRADGETPAEVNQRVSAERQAAAERAIAEDPQVNALREAFDAEVAPGSVRPRDDQ